MRVSRAMMAVALVPLLFAGALLATYQNAEPLPPRPPLARPTLLLLSSLPLVFPEGFSLRASGSPTLRRLEQQYRVKSIALADADGLKGARLLLMAHPRAQTAEGLVDLDHWVRTGGRVLVLADPLLEWPSDRPLGDRLRPSPGFADTGLLAHWGLVLEGPVARGPATVMLDGRRLSLFSPGHLTSKACPLFAGGIVARCTVGRGNATIIADADLLNPALSGKGIGENLEGVAAELGRFDDTATH